MREYRYILSLDDDNPTIVHPNWSSGQTKQITTEQGQYFYRPKITGTFTFLRADFDLINDAPFETEFKIDVFYREQNSNDIFLPDWKGVFYKTDLQQINEDKKSVQVEPELLDEYKPIIEGMDKEIDLLKVSPPTYEFTYYKQPVFQIIALGQTVLTNVLGGISFEQDLSTIPAGGGDLFTNYSFGFLGIHGVVTAPTGGIDPDVSGEYCDETGAVITDGNLGYRRKSDGAYRVKLRNFSDPDSKWVIEEVSTGTELYESYELSSDGALEELTFFSLSTGDEVKFEVKAFYGRYLTDQEEVDSVPTNEIPDPDVVPNAVGYTKVLPIGGLLTTATYGAAYQSAIIVSDDAQDEPTQYGKFGAGSINHVDQYFARPVTTDLIQPLAASRWNEASFWIRYSTWMKDQQLDGATEQVANCYKISEVIQTVLTELGATVAHEATAAYSEFLYGTNSIRASETVPIIAPKSLIIVGENKEPTRQAIIRMSDIDGLLKKTWKCGWYIKDGKFVIEKDEFFHRGESYSTPVIGLDLTTAREPKTGYPWEFHARISSYEKSNIPGQITTGYMDESSEPFRGLPIDIQSRFADKGQIEEIIVANFSADIDFMQIAPDRVSRDGFLFAEAQEIDGELSLPFVTMTLGALGEYVLQNGYAAFIWLQDKYHKYVMPTDTAMINLEEITAESVRRSRIQKITIPSHAVTEPSQLIRTALGDGKLREVSDKRDQSGSEVTIEHDL